MATFHSNSGGYDAWFSRNPEFRKRFSFGWLNKISQACRRAFHAEALPAPTEHDSSHRRALKFTVLLAARPWPQACDEFWHAMHEWFDIFVREQAEVQAARALRRGHAPPVVAVDDLVREELLMTIRNAECWLAKWRAKGASSSNDYFGWLLRDLPTKIRRRSRGLPRFYCHDRVGDLGAGSVGCSAPVADCVEQDAPKEAFWPLALDEHLDSLTPLQQRVLRLRFGFFPLLPHEKPLTVARLAKALNRPKREVVAAYDEGRLILRARRGG